MIRFRKGADVNLQIYSHTSRSPLWVLTTDTIISTFIIEDKFSIIRASDRLPSKTPSLYIVCVQYV